MNKRQESFIEKLDSHLRQDISLGEMKTWLNQNIYSVLIQSNVEVKPGMWLEFYACREIYWHIADLEDEAIQQATDQSWYWQEVKQIQGLLLGNEIYERTIFRLEAALNHKERENDQWMLPHLRQVEAIFQKLAAITDKANSPLPFRLDLEFDPGPLNSRTYSEIIMNEILQTVQDEEMLETLATSSSISSVDINLARLNRLDRLLKCFRGEQYYSVSTIFEGLDKFVITLAL